MTNCPHQKISTEPMKTIALTLLLAALVCSGCATRYDMKLTNGSVITAKGKPRVDEQRHVIFFNDANGKTNAIPQFRVVEISPHSVAMSEEDQTKNFNPVMKR